MPINISTHAREGNTFVINFQFWDESSLAFAPNSLYWTLHSQDGTVINGRSMSGITSLQTSIDLVLTSADMMFQADRQNFRAEKRYVTLEGNYNSSLGTNLSLSEQVRFTIDPLIKLT